MLEIFSIYTITILFVVFTVLNHLRKRFNHPPGPLGLPYVGQLPLNAIKTIFPKYFPITSQKTYFKEMKEKYGDFWSVEMGGQRIVTLASFDLIHEAFVQNGNVFCGKPINETFNTISEGQGILLIDGELWRDNRQMAIKAFHELGVGLTDFEKHISDEADALMEHLTNIPKSQNIEFIYAESNVISRLVFNETNEYEDPKFKTFLLDLKCAYQSEVLDTKCNFFPNCLKANLTRFIFPDIDRYFKAWANITTFVTRKCEQRRGKLSETVTPNCIFDYFWKYRYENEPDVTCATKMLEISHSMVDLYMAGTDTANSLLRFCCLMLGKYPQVQKDLRSEIKVHADHYKHISMDMKKEWPKLLSFIDEIHRFCCLLPKFHRRVMKPCMLRGYQIYPDDIIIGDWGTVSQDDSLFANPEVFDAYRFMDTDRTCYVPNKHMIPFGIGKRSCLGHSIAIMELFLFLSKLILAFDISLPSETLDNFDNILEGRSGLIHAPLECAVILNSLNPS